MQYKQFLMSNSRSIIFSNKRQNAYKAELMTLNRAGQK